MAWVMRLALLITFLVFTSTLVLAQNTVAPCAMFSLNGPAGITRPGDVIEFRVQAQRNGTFTYEWKVEGFKFSGQGSPRIEIQTGRQAGNVNAAVAVKVLDHEMGCSVLLSDSAVFGPTLPGPDHDWFEIIDGKNGDLKGRLDTFFSELTNNPEVEGIIEITFTKNSSRAGRLAKLNLVSKHIAYRRFNPSRISYHLTIGEYERIRAIRMPPGADYEYYNIDRQKLIKAEEYKAKASALF